MTRRPRARAVLLALVALSVAGGLGEAVAAAKDPISVTAAFDRDAALGASTALDVAVQLDPRRLTTAPLTEVRFFYPRGLGLVSSGLGLASCVRPAQDFAQVLLAAPGLAGCPRNAVMGYGSARALVRLSSGDVIREYATVTLLSGPIDRGRLGLVVFVDGQRPFGAKLAFAGTVGGAPAPYGGALTVRMPVVPGLQDVATIALVRLNITIGAHAIRYSERRRGRVVSYHPDGVVLPPRCPRHAFEFRAEVGFADGSRRAARTVTPCPSAVAPPATGR